MVRIGVSEGILVATIDNPPVNALSANVRRGLLDAVRKAVADPHVCAVVITAAGKTFIAGADITEFGKAPQSPSLPELTTALEGSPKPVVAAINGATLGGGLEIALACHARFAAPGAKFGLPEVKLGLIPGAGGTQRLPRLIGAAPAFRMMRDGEILGAEAARDLGIVDVVVDGALVEKASAHARDMARKGSWPIIRNSTDRLTDDDRVAFEELAKESARKAAEMPNVAAIIEAVREAFDSPFEEGLAIERTHFLRLLEDDRSKALRYVFFAERKTARVPGLPKDIRARPVRHAAVIGAGTMGGGIASCFANAGIPVTLIEASEDALTRGITRIAESYNVSVRRGTITANEMQHRLDLIDGRIGITAVSGADIVIEAAFEDIEVKRSIFAELSRLTPPRTILATRALLISV
jgi:3-hydroxyacyl-CoA dehydrogenase